METFLLNTIHTFNHISVMPTCSEGIGPRHLIFSDDGQIAYLISELSGTISVFSRDVEGNLNVIETVLADNANARGSADLHLMSRQ